MRFLSLFSGIEAASTAWSDLGWECVGFSEIESFPCELLAQRHPGVRNLGDVTKITEADILSLGHIDLVVFGSPCFTDGHTVLTARGLVPIETVVVGDMVWTHASRWKRVSNIMTRIAPTVIVNGQGHNAIRATPDHPFYAADTSKTWNGNGYTRSLAEPEWVHAADMIGKRWAAPTNLTCDTSVPEDLRSLDAAYLAGLYLGDGHIGRTTGRDKKSVILSVGFTKRDKILPKLRAAWGTVSCLAHGMSVVRLQLSRTHMADALLDNFGELSHAKSIPVWALCASAEWQTAFLQGILDTDGSAKANGFRVTTVSRALAVGLRLLAARLGYSSSLNFSERPETCEIEGRTVNQRDTWTVALRKGNRTSELRTGEHTWGLVRSVTPAADAQVYDITVEDDHSFICDGIVVHNCQDLSVAGKQKGLSGARSGLFFTAIQIVQWAREWCDCRFALWENVPGAFGSNAGRDFAAVVDALSGVAGTAVPPKGWGNEGCAVGPEAMVEWATLDAQWFGVAQRRRRVFAIADFGDWRSRPPILLESEGLRGDTAPRRETGQSVAPCLDVRAGRSGENNFNTSGGLVPVAGTLSSRNNGGGGLGTDFDLAGGLVPERRPVLTSSGEISHCLNAGGMGRTDYETETFIIGFNHDAQPDEMRFDPHLSASLTCSQHSAVAYRTKLHNTTNNQAGKIYAEYTTAIDCNSPPPVVMYDGCSMPNSLYNKGIKTIGVHRGSTPKTNAVEVLRILRAAVGEEAFAKWGLGILDSLQPPEVLRSALHGSEFQPAAFSTSWVVYCALSREKSGSNWLLQSLRETGCVGCPPQGWEPPEQLTRQLGAYLSELSQPGAQAERFMHDLWQASEGIGFLRHALSEVQKTRRLVGCEGQPIYAGAQGLRAAHGKGLQGAGLHRQVPREGVLQQTRPTGREGDARPAGSDEAGVRAKGMGNQAYKVRRLTVAECEFLMGFPRGYTAVNKGRKRAADGPRYKALGNSMAVPVMAWIGRQIDFAVGMF